MKNILVCDDDTSIRQIVAMIIESEFDNPIVLASSASEAVNILKTNPNIGLIFCDFNMPGDTGALVFNYNIDAQNIPFYMMTGEYSETFKGVDNLKANPLNGVLQKPWAENELFNIINKVLISGE